MTQRRDRQGVDGLRPAVVEPEISAPGGQHDHGVAQSGDELATIGGARALGLDDRIGSLEVGKEADLAAFRIDIARTTPVGDPYSTAIFALPGRSAELVAVRGNILVEKGCSKASSSSLTARLEATGAALSAWSSGVTQ